MSCASLTRIGPSSSINYLQAAMVNLVGTELVIEYLEAFVKLHQKLATILLDSHPVNSYLDSKVACY